MEKLMFCGAIWRRFTTLEHRSTGRSPCCGNRPSACLSFCGYPWVFPAVAIDGEIFSDGSIKLNTPISPALRLGADRLFGSRPQKRRDRQLAQ